MKKSGLQRSIYSLSDMNRDQTRQRRNKLYDNSLVFVIYSLVKYTLKREKKKNHRSARISQSTSLISQKKDYTLAYITTLLVIKKSCNKETSFLKLHGTRSMICIKFISFVLSNFLFN
jgi:hypothetical protein